jgi:ABC-type tungstate transport system permease subunit
VEIYAGTQDVYQRARNGKADMVLSHYGFSEVESFVTEGFGLWPRLVFANQAALLGPPGDPAHIRGLADAVEGFRRIAQTKSPFLINNDPTVKYIAEVLWQGADRPQIKWAPTRFGASIPFSDFRSRISLTYKP